MGNCKFFSLEGVLNSWCFRLEHYLFGTLPVATRFNPESVDVLIEQNFRKGSKNGTMLTKTEKIWNFGHVCCQIREILSLFLYQIAFWIPFCFNVQVNGSSILQKHSWIESKLIIICEEKCFFSIFWIFVSFGGQSFSNKFENLEFFHQFAFFWRPTTKKAANFSCKRLLWT